VLCLQEHWPHSFEKRKLQEYFPMCGTHIKCFDDNTQIPINHYGRGHAGVAIVWAPEMNDYITPIDDGSNRTIAALVSTTPPLVIINTYLPAGNAKADHMEYQNVLDEVLEIVQKYSHNHQIVWVGDLNGSFDRSPPCTRDALLRRLCEEVNISPDGDTSIPSYYHNNAGTPTSRIDHVIPILPVCHIDMSVSVRAREALNTSPHDPVVAHFKSTLGSVMRNTRKATCTLNSSKQRIHWDKVDEKLYVEHVKESLLNSDSLKSESADSLLDMLNGVLYHASTQSLLEEHSLSQKRVRPTKRKLWHPDLKPLIKSCQSAHKIWRYAGKPRDGPVFQLPMSRLLCLMVCLLVAMACVSLGQITSSTWRLQKLFLNLMPSTWAL
jgi:hypothetical protein